MGKPNKMAITKEELYDLYVVKKMSQVDIGKLFDVDRKAVDYQLKKHNIPKRSKSQALRLHHDDVRGTEITRKAIVALVEDGFLLQEVADKLNISRSTLYDRMIEFGIELGNNHEAQRKRQSEFMSSNNPVPKGTPREQYIIDAMIEGTKKASKIRRDNIDNFRQYARVARAIAYAYYGRGAEIPEGFVIDHIFSIKDGWDNEVHVEDISNKNNLRLISQKENLEKGAKSLITFEEFKNLIGK